MLLESVRLESSRQMVELVVEQSTNKTLVLVFFLNLLTVLAELAEGLSITKADC